MPPHWILAIMLKMKKNMSERMNLETGRKEKRLPTEEVTRLISEEYFKNQKELQLLLLKDEKALDEGSAVLKNRSVLNEKSTIATRRMMEAGMDTFPKYEGGNIPHPAAIEDPREIVGQIDTEWDGYNRHYREDVNHVLEKISNFCKKWELDFTPYFREDISAKTLWKELQKAYHARMFEMQSGYEGDADLNDIS